MPQATTVAGNRLFLADGSDVAFDRLLSPPAAARTSAGSSRSGSRSRRRGIEVDERLRAAENVWAIGDVTGIALFTHVGKYHARIAAYDIVGRAARADHRAIPATIFTDPQVATVGDIDGRAMRRRGRSPRRRDSRPTSGRSATAS